MGLDLTCVSAHKKDNENNLFPIVKTACFHECATEFQAVYLPPCNFSLQDAGPSPVISLPNVGSAEYMVVLKKYYIGKSGPGSSLTHWYQNDST